VGNNANSQGHQTLSAISRFFGFDRIEGQLLAYQSTRSIWGTATELATTGNLLVAMLIVLFSVVIPCFKLCLLALSLVADNARLRRPVLWLNAILSKWSMTDVFVMALLVAYMAGSAAGKMGDMLIMQAQLEVGFYWFLAYCLFSIVASALLSYPSRSELGLQRH
jgi:uncharacterized paraquat-inducible protein A